MSTLTQFANIPNLGTLGVLEKLAEAFRETTKNPQKKANSATLFLKSGTTLRGYVISLTDDTGPKTAVIIPEESSGEDLAYIFTSEIVGVVVHHASTLIEQLSDGRIAKPMSNAPSMTELNRLAKTAIDEINALCEGKMSLQITEPPAKSRTEVFHALYQSLRDLYIILRKLASEELGRQHLAERNFQFTLKTGETAEVQVRDTQFLVFIGIDGESVDRVSRDTIRTYLEEFL